MYAVAVTILFKEGKLGELKDFFENTGFPALEVLKGDMYSIAFFNPKDNVNLGIAFMKDKETADKFAQIRNENFCLLYTSPSPRDISGSRMPSSA